MREEIQKIVDPTPTYSVEPGQTIVIDRYRPEDANGVVNLFRLVYGEDYPLKQYYDPAWLTSANGSHDLISVVARTPKGDIVSHMAAYRSAAVNPELYEIGVGLTLSGYHAASEIMRHIVAMLPSFGLAGIYGEAVCNHLVTQRFSYDVGCIETAIEIDLMPAETYRLLKNSVGRVSCLFTYLPFRTAPQTLHVPALYLDPVRFILDPVPGERRLVAAGSTAAGQEKAQVETRVFDFASVSRCQVVVCGEDIAARLADMERAADAQMCTTRQVFLNLGDPAVGQAAQWLRDQGYSLAGVTPGWFSGDRDGLLLHKMLHTPDFGAVKLYRERAWQLLARVEADWRSVNG
ncbi:hypothetical protein MXC99_11735 [Thauera aromatica]|uniref:hypothetical protein n=1 Tax=Thauera aromatica TaxID=59405 RepID=UPI001FFDE053|nr:hypothetical protein [Thauera aromatica]MCK2088843.1 hypothetical protein [Thauera aromatica]